MSFLGSEATLEITVYPKWQELAEHEEDLGVSVWVKGTLYDLYSSFLLFE